MKYNGKELHKYTKQELIEICEELIKVIGFCDSTHPEDLDKDDVSEGVWSPPKRVNVVVKK